MKKEKALTTFFIIFSFLALASTRAYGQQTIGILLTVNSTEDAADADPGDSRCADINGYCTLRAAVEEANATAVRDVINFHLDQPANIDLSLGELAITRDLDIVGAGARLTLIGRSTAKSTGVFRVFHVIGPAIFTLRGVTLRNGFTAVGGAIMVDSGSSVLITDSAISGNRATTGGAIAVAGKLTIKRCLINSNVADTHGGAIRNIQDADLTILNSTLTGNSAAVGGAIHNAGTALLANVTISENSANIAASSFFNEPGGSANSINSLIGRDIEQKATSLQGQFQSYGNNIVTDSRNSSGFINGVNGDQVSENNVIDPRLGPLADNGGQTDTRALLADSPAINNANNCVLRNMCSIPVSMFWDQRRGYARFPGSMVDIGAFEAEASSSSGSFVIGGVFIGSARFTGSIAVQTNARTNVKRYSALNPFGFFRFQDLFQGQSDVNIQEIRSKRIGIATGPFVVDFEPFTQSFRAFPAEPGVTYEFKFAGE